MIKFILKDNTKDDYVPIDPVKPVAAFPVKEENWQNGGRTFEFGTSGVSIVESATASTGADLNDFDQNKTSVYTKLIPVNGPGSPTDYIGAYTVDLPHIIDPNFADFLLVDIQKNSFATLASATEPEQFAIPFFDATDSGNKIVRIFNGLQALRIPTNKFNTILTDTAAIAANDNNSIKKNPGKYYIKISPKFLEVTIDIVLPRQHNRITEATSSDERRQLIQVFKEPFIGTIWGFDSVPAQKGRLFGSMVEVWNSTTTTLKQQKTIAEDNLKLDSGSTTSYIGLTPDLIGYDTENQAATAGDKLRIYPRETYFTPIFVEIEYVIQDLTTLVQFLKNDVARDITTGIFEIYDDNGIQLDSQGNPEGTVTQAYQVSQEGNREVRRQIKL